MNLLALGIIGFSGLLLLIFSLSARRTPPKLRVIPAFTRLYRAIGLSVEDGTRLLISLGTGSLLARNGAAALAGLNLLRGLSQRISMSDRPPAAVAGEASLALLGQDTLQAGYQAAGAAEYYEPEMGRLTGMTPFSAAAGTMPILRDENISAGALIGHFGVEGALLAEAAERGNVLLVGASDDPAAQAVFFAAAPDALIGEELFAAAAYLGGSTAHAASLKVQDVLRWLIILVLLAGAALKFLGVI